MEDKFLKIILFDYDMSNIYGILNGLKKQTNQFFDVIALDHSKKDLSFECCKIFQRKNFIDLHCVVFSGTDEEKKKKCAFVGKSSKYFCIIDKYNNEFDDCNFIKKLIMFSNDHGSCDISFDNDFKVYDEKEDDQKLIFSKKPEIKIKNKNTYCNNNYEFDIVYVLGKGSSHNNEELRYSLRSVEKYIKGVRNVFVVGYNPGFLSDNVIYIPTVDPYPHDHANKDRNHWHNIETVCQDKRLSENFLFAADDNIVLKDSVWDDFKPRYCGIATDKYLSHINDPKIQDWTRTRIQTLLRFPKDQIKYLWHPHMFSQLNKTKFLQCCKDSDYYNRNDVVIFTYYYNHEPIPTPIENFDSEEYHTAKKITFNCRHISHWDEAFSFKDFHDQLKDLFPTKSRYEAFDISDKDLDATIIIPCYNTEQYIEECIDSLKSNNKNFEIICIDDGSTDNTYKILKKISTNNDKIKIFHYDENKGQSYARNIGIDNALGKYIIFLDSDDKFKPYSIDIIVNEMNKNNLDILYINAASFFDSQNLENKYQRYKGYYNRPQLPKVCSGVDSLLFFFNNNYNGYAACENCFRREFLTNINAKYCNGIFFEDAPFNIKAALYSEKTFNITEKLYMRRIRENSTVLQQKTFKHFRSFVIASLLLTKTTILKSSSNKLSLFLYKYQIMSHFNQAAAIYKQYEKNNEIFSDVNEYNDSDQILHIFNTLVKNNSLEDFKKCLEIIK